MGVGFVLAETGIAALGLTLLVAGVQLVRGRWRRMIAGASALSERELESGLPRQAARAIGTFLIAIALAVGGGASYALVQSYEPSSDAVLMIVGVIVLLSDALVIFAFRATQHPDE